MVSYFTIVRHHNTITSLCFDWQTSLEGLKAAGGSSHDADQLMSAHQRDLQTLNSQMQADKLRMQDKLQQRLNTKRQQRIAHKKSSIDSSLTHKMLDVNNDSRQQKANIKNQEVKCKRH